MSWEPSETVSVEQIQEASKNAEPTYETNINVEEYLIRIESMGLPWDVGGAIYTPTGPIATGPDGKSVGVFLIHGGGGDHRGFDVMARLLASNKKYKVVTVSYPGNLYLDNESHDWPGDTMEDDGTARTPMWLKGEIIGRDQYDLVEDKGEDVFRAKYGTLFFAKAKPGTRFYDRLAAWPAAYQDAYLEVCKQFLIKAQQIGQFAAYDALRNAATATAARLKLDDQATKELQERYLAYPSPLPSSVKPLPPLLYCIMANSRDHSFQRYNGILLPELAKLDTPPRARIVRFETGIHSYQMPRPGLPYGTAPAVTDIWDQAIMGGYFLPN